MLIRRIRLFFVVLSAVSDFAWSADGEGILIVRARWGNHLREVDVTEKVRDRLHDGTIEMKIGTEALGDPSPRHGKKLRVTYRYNGAEQTMEFTEGQTLKLPRPESANAGNVTYRDTSKQQVARITSALKSDERHKTGVEIGQAVFGTDGMWRDITTAAQQSMSNGSWRADLHHPYTEVGGDPAVGKPKHLIVGYWVDGAPKVAIFDELPGEVVHVNVP
jgi:hypothetical protein